MNIFDSYTQRVRNSIQQDKIHKSMQESYRTFSTSGSGVKAKETKAAPVRRDLQPEGSQLTLNDVVGRTDLSDARIGLHPSFRYLIGTEETAKHYITSVFMDIKGSTKMHDTYDLETLYNITNTIQSAAIHVCLLLGGHIQRLQGDGVFVYFGGKGVSKEDSVRQAITATSMFTYFVQNDLEKLFEEDGVDNISTRTGIDFGDDDEVLWGNFGVGNCIELTTLSLHTSLASKCQQHAKKNGIIVGRNVKDRAKLDEKLFDYVRDDKGNVHYIHEGRKKGVYYSHFHFDWFNYLKSLSYIRSDANDNLYIFSKEKQEEERLARLRSTARLVSAGTAYTSPTGVISADTTGVKNQQHRFHHE